MAAGSIISSMFAGVHYNLGIGEEVKDRLNDPTATDVTALVPVCYIDDDDDDVEDEVELLWILCVMKWFKFSRKVIDHRSTSRDARIVFVELIKKLCPVPGDEGVSETLRNTMAQTREDLLSAFSDVRAGSYPVPLEVLFDDVEGNPGAVEFAMSIGFCGADLNYPIPPANHRYVAALVNATQGVEVDADDVGLIHASSLAPADIPLLRALAACDAPVFVAAFNHRLSLATPQLDFLGHLLYTVTDDAPEEAVNLILANDKLFEYLTTRDVRRDDRTVVQTDADGHPKVVAYDSRIERVAKELFPRWPAARTAAFKDILREKWAVAPAYNAGVLNDPVQEAIEEYVLPTAAADAAAAPAADDNSLEGQFTRATQAATKLKKLSNDERLALYAHYKQATDGDCDRPRPGIFDFEGKAKWNAWTGIKGMGTDDAMEKYCALVAGHIAAAN